MSRARRPSPACSRAVALLLLILAPPVPTAADSAGDRAAIETLMTGPVPEVLRSLRDFELLNVALIEFYEQRDYESAKRSSPATAGWRPTTTGSR